MWEKGEREERAREAEKEIFQGKISAHPWLEKEAELRERMRLNKSWKTDRTEGDFDHLFERLEAPLAHCFALEF